MGNYMLCFITLEDKFCKVFIRTEGKWILDFCAYKYLAKLVFKSDELEDVVAHVFLLLEWNIISWSEHVVDSNIYLVSFWQDALMFDIGKNK